MRNLTIRRHKSFVACLAKMKVYIEDPIGGETTINDVPCRKLGVLKNGEEKTFSIDNDERRVYVIADRLSKGFCNDYFIIPAGECDVELSGKNRYNPATGNAFRFDGVDDAEVLKNRKKGTRIGIIVLIAAALIGFVIGFLSNFPLIVKDKVFEIDGMSITLTNKFSADEQEGFTASFTSENAYVVVLKEPFTLLEGLEDYTLEEYGEMARQNTPVPAGPLKNADGLVYFEYDWTNSDIDQSFYYFISLHKSHDAFWIVELVTYAENKEEYRPIFIEQAKTVTFEP